MSILLQQSLFDALWNKMYSDFSDWSSLPCPAVSTIYHLSPYSWNSCLTVLFCMLYILHGAVYLEIRIFWVSFRDFYSALLTPDFSNFYSIFTLSVVCTHSQDSDFLVNKFGWIGRASTLIMACPTLHSPQYPHCSIFDVIQSLHPKMVNECIRIIRFHAALVLRFSVPSD